MKLYWNDSVSERTERIYKRMLAHYRYLGLIDTGAYNLEALLPLANKIADTLKLEGLYFAGIGSLLEEIPHRPLDVSRFCGY